MSVNSDFIASLLKLDNYLILLREAASIEQKFAQGLSLAVNRHIILKAFINKDSWSFFIEMDHGQVNCEGLDADLNEFLISTQFDPNLIDISEYSEEIQAGVMRNLKRSHKFSLSDPDLCRSSKLYFKDDPVMKNVTFPGGTNLADQLSYQLRLQRKSFLEFNKEYAFLWKNTGFYSPTELLNFIENNKI